MADIASNVKVQLPLVVLVGRANVGKSTLFNRMSGARRALVSDVPGTTRDVKKTTVTWSGHSFELFDTGGFTPDNRFQIKDLHKRQTDTSGQTLQSKIIKQTGKILSRADVILFVVDVQNSITPLDREMVKTLRSFTEKGELEKIPIILVANKADNPQKRLEAGALMKLGLGEPVVVSAANGSGVGDLLDRIVETIASASRVKDTGYRGKIAGTSSQITDHKLETESSSVHSATSNLRSETSPLRLCILGQPNVGKSSLLNAILKEERAVVHHEPHTTREPNDTAFTFGEHPMVLIDTAGIRRRTQKADPLEKGGVSMTKIILRRSDLAAFVIDAQDLYNSQNKRLAGFIGGAYKAAVIVVNKWDLVPEKDTHTADKLSEHLRMYYPHLAWAPIVFVSAKTGKSVDRLLEEALRADASYRRTITDAALGKLLKKCIAKQQPPLSGARKKRPFLSRFVQTGIRPPTFSITIESAVPLPEFYFRYLENQLREAFDFTGTPLQISTQYIETKPRKKL